MNRKAPLFTLLAAILIACEPPAPAAEISTAGFAGRPVAARRETWEKTVTRRLRWGPGVDAMASPFPDGRRMALIDWTTGDVAIFDLETEELTRITEQAAPFAEGVAMFPVVSPDGERIAYTWESWSPRDTHEMLRIADVAGGSPRTVYVAPGFEWVQVTDWSPDGTQLLVLRSTDDAYEIASIAVSDGSARTIRRLGVRYPTQVRFSPDGRFLAYDYPTEEDSDERDVHLLAPDGGRDATLVGGPGDDRLLGWTPDGRGVLFLSDRSGTPGAWLLPMSGGRAAGDPDLVKPDMWSTEPLGFDRNGRYYYAVGVGSRALYELTFSADGRSITSGLRDLSSRTYQEVLHPVWSPDGAHIAFAVARQGRPGALIVRAADSGEEREIRLDRRVEYHFQHEWLPDNRTLIALVQEEQTGSRPVISVDVRTGATSTILSPELPDWVDGIALSPDGRTLYYIRRHFSDTAPRETIMARDLASGAEHLVYEGEHRLFRITISPDGASLAFIDGTQNDTRRTVVLPLAGGPPRTVIEGADAPASIAWTRDGRALVLAWRANPEDPLDQEMRLERLELDTRRRIPLDLARTGLGRSRVSFHPDGRRAVVTAGQPESEWWVMEGFLEEESR